MSRYNPATRVPTYHATDCSTQRHTNADDKMECCPGCIIVHRRTQPPSINTLQKGETLIYFTLGARGGLSALRARVDKSQGC